MSTVLSLPSSQTHARMFAPLVRRTEAESKHEIKVFYLASSIEKLGFRELEMHRVRHPYVDAHYVYAKRPYPSLPVPSRWALILKLRPAVLDLFRQHRPALIVLGSDHGAVEKLFVHTARLHHIRSLLLQDGILAK